MSAILLTPAQVLAIDEWLDPAITVDHPNDVVLEQHPDGVLVSYGPVLVLFLPDGTMIPEET
jgi:hypothetical protein